MRNPLWWVFVSLAVVWVASTPASAHTGQTPTRSMTTPTVQQQKTTFQPQQTTLITQNASANSNAENSTSQPQQTTLITQNASTNSNAENSTSQPQQATSLPSQSVIIQNTSTNSTTEGSVQHFGRGRAPGGPESAERVFDVNSSTGVVREGEYECGCPNNWECVCTNPTGKIVSVPGYQDDTTWTFNLKGVTSSSPILVKVYFFASDVPFAERDWTLRIGSSTEFEKASELREKNTLYIRSNEEIYYDKGKDSEDLDIVLYYEALAPEHSTERISGNNMSGVIRFPTNTTEDPDLGYVQQRRNMWTFEYPENYIVELNLTKLDLGYRRSDVHWLNTQYDFIENDFVLIGLGTEIMESTDKVFFSHFDEVKTVRVNHPSAHIVMFSAYHEQWAGGLEISYAALEVIQPSSTTTLAPTTAAPELGLMPSTVAPIDGARKDNTSGVSSAFRSAVSGMATEYISTHGLSVQPPPSVEPSDVTIHWAATCLQTTCSQYCAAFNFSIRKLAKTGTTWAFSSDTLDLMVREDALQHYWKLINEDSEFCEESAKVNWYVFGGVALGAVLLAVLISLAVWKIKNIADARQSKKEIDQDLKQEELERRRRSSGDESVIGGMKGGARMSLPFGGTRGSVDSGQSSQDDEADDFPEHDPDFGYDNFGLGADLLNDNRARNFYSNAAFEDDAPPSDHIGYKQLHQVALGDPQPSTSAQGLVMKPIPVLKSSLKKRRSSQEAYDNPTKDRETSPKKVITVVEEEDEDSFTESDDDGDGTVQFKSVAFRPKKQISIQADVHQPGGSDFGETVL